MCGVRVGGGGGGDGGRCVGGGGGGGGGGRGEEALEPTGRPQAGPSHDITVYDTLMHRHAKDDVALGQARNLCQEP